MTDPTQAAPLEERARRWESLVVLTVVAHTAFSIHIQAPILVIPDNDEELARHNLQRALTTPNSTLILAMRQGEDIILESHPVMASVQLDAREAFDAVGVLAAPQRLWRPPLDSTPSESRPLGERSGRLRGSIQRYPLRYATRVPERPTLEHVHALADVLGITHTKLRAALDLPATPGPLAPDQAQRLQRAALLADHARHELKGDDAAGAWLTASDTHLGSISPLHACRTHEGATRAHQLLQQLSHGIFG